jgi:hypothetical protein
MLNTHGNDREISEVFDSYTTNAVYVGTVQKVWIYGQDERGILGRTKNFTQVVLRMNEQEIACTADSLIGKCVAIKVTEA